METFGRIDLPGPARGWGISFFATSYMIEDLAMGDGGCDRHQGVHVDRARPDLFAQGGFYADRQTGAGPPRRSDSGDISGTSSEQREA
jgi:hypothetical protein